MTDVFVAYSSKDEPQVRALVAFLRANGLDVWVAYEQPAGLDWDQEIDRVVAAARCVLAVWSPDAVQSPEVKGEARAAMARNALVPVSLHGESPPRSFTHLHAIDITGIVVDEDSERTRQVLRGVHAHVDRPGDPESDEHGAAKGSGNGIATDGDPDIPEEGVTPAPGASPSRRWPLLAGVAVVSLVIVGLLALRAPAAECHDEDVLTLTGQTFSEDTELVRDIVCIARDAEVKVRNGAALRIDAGTLVVQPGAFLNGRGAAGKRGDDGNDGPRHHSRPPRVRLPGLGDVAICGKPPPRRDYSGSAGQRGGDGGPGARIVIRYRELRGDLDKLRHDVAGGTPGSGGAGGAAGWDRCTDGKPYEVKGKAGARGASGAPGKAGSFEVMSMAE